MTRLCVFCGSNVGVNPAFAHTARALGVALVDRGIDLVYGGGKVGLMGVVADAVLAAGGRAIGVIPQALVDREVAHGGLTELHVVSSMHERKAMMAALSDGFVALPGGFGTLEEFCEAVTWTQLGVHAKPCGLLNVGGFYDGLLAFLEHALAEQFLRIEHRDMVLSAPAPDALLDKMQHWTAPTVPKWIGLGAT